MRHAPRVIVFICVHERHCALQLIHDRGHHEIRRILIPTRSSRPARLPGGTSGIADIPIRISCTSINDKFRSKATEKLRVFKNKEDEERFYQGGDGQAAVMKTSELQLVERQAAVTMISCSAVHTRKKCSCKIHPKKEKRKTNQVHPISLQFNLALHKCFFYRIFTTWIHHRYGNCV